MFTNISGILFYSIVAGAISAFVLSLIILRLYKRAVIKGMNLNVPSLEEVLTNTTQYKSLNQQLNFIYQDYRDAAAEKNLRYIQLQRFLARRLWIYAIATSCFALLWSLIYLYAGNIPVNSMNLLYFMLLFAWPFVFSQNIIWATNSRQQITSYAGYIVLFLLGVVYIYSAQDENFRFTRLFTPWLTYNLIPTVLILLIRLGRVKSISTLITGYCFVAFLVANLVIAFLSINDTALKLVFDVIYDTGMHNVSFYFFALLLIVSFMIGAISLWGINRLYLRKYINEQQLSVDAVFLIFNCSYLIFLLSGAYTLTVGFFCLLPFLAYKSVCLIQFKLLKVQEQNKAPIKLLLLRVFALNKKSQASFEKIRRHWQYAGPILMITGPDLATTTIDAHELADFVSNRLKQHFCDSTPSIERNLSMADLKPDKDGAFRINEFFCRNNIWKDILVKLVGMSDVVLIDLRSFSGLYKGCQYEIQQLVNYMPLSKVLVLVNEKTDIDFLKTTFTLAFKYIHSQSPNLMLQYNVQLYFFKPEVASNFYKLLQQLCVISDDSLSDHTTAVR